MNNYKNNVKEYNNAVADIYEQLEIYRNLRENDEWNLLLFQDVRDELSEALLYYGPLFAEIRAEAEMAENNRRLCLEENKLFWREKLSEERGSVSLAESKALLDCEDSMIEENKKKELYYKAKELMERTDQVLNAISSRIKYLLKYEQEEDVYDKQTHHR